MKKLAKIIKDSAATGVESGLSVALVIVVAFPTMALVFYVISKIMDLFDKKEKYATTNNKEDEVA